MRSLQDAGLAVGAPIQPSLKRISVSSATNGNDNHSGPTSPLSPEAVRNRFSNSNLSSASASAASNNNSHNSSTSSSTNHSPHAFVPTSSLGLAPSPASSPSHSPEQSTYSLTEFSQHFPSIDEFEEITSSTNGVQLDHTRRNTRRDAGLFNVNATGLNFPILPVDPGPRPSSTPITPNTNSFVSRPASPVVGSPAMPIPIPRKPSALGLGLGLGLGHSPKASLSSVSGSMHSPKPSLSSFPSISHSPKPSLSSLPNGVAPLPRTNSLRPKELYDFMYRGGFRTPVLMLDMRTREEFEKERIKADAIVCIEPSVLLRDK